MGLNAAMQAGVAGLAANSVALSAISNNIANVNTTAYKRVRSDFAAIVTSSSSPTGYNAGGVIATTRHTISQLGTLQTAPSEMDLGIDGQGFFITTQIANAGSTDPHLFTRDGSFTPDKEGYLRNASGLYLQGWPVSLGGGATLSSADLSQLVAINVDNISAIAEATTQADIVGNLKSDQAISTDAATYVASDPSLPATRTMSKHDATATPNPGVKPDYEISVPVSDSQGGKQAMTMSLLKTGPNSWAYEVWSNSADSTAHPNNIVNSGTLTFNESGTLASITDSAGVTTTPAAAFTFDIDWDPSLGVAQQSLTLDMGSTSGVLTQYNAPYTSTVTADGTPFADVAEIKISDKGMVTAVFENGSTRDIAQLALATFVNADGLVPVSGNAYTVSNSSGPFVLKVPGENGSGLISVGTLEASDVDLSQEFTGLITTQRAYSASSKIITTADEMLQELLNIKR